MMNGVDRRFKLFHALEVIQRSRFFDNVVDLAFSLLLRSFMKNFTYIIELFVFFLLLSLYVVKE